MCGKFFEILRIRFTLISLDLIKSSKFNVAVLHHSDFIIGHCCWHHSPKLRHAT